MATKAKLPSTAVGRRRLLKLADLLEADAKNEKGIKFDLCGWGHTTDSANPIACGTYACAMGLAVASRAFERAGLKPPDRVGYLVPRVGRLKGYEAAAKLFHIDYYDARHFFAPSSYRLERGARAERAVAKRIRDFVAGKAAP